MSAKRTFRDLIETDIPEAKRQRELRISPLPGKVYVAKTGSAIPSRKDLYVVEIGFSPKEFGVLSQYNLKDENDCPINNIWQFSKWFKYVDKQEQTKTYNGVTTDRWFHPAEIHISAELQIPNQKYWEWREKGMKMPHNIIFPNGYYSSNKNTGFLVETVPSDDHVFCVDLNTKKPYRKISLIEARKQILCDLYTRLCIKHPKFIELREFLNTGKSIVIADNNGPNDIESLKCTKLANVSLLDSGKHAYYHDIFELENCVRIDCKETIQVLMNEPSHTFSHGYVIAALLQDPSGSWFET
jgi:hypothetical protein